MEPISAVENIVQDFWWFVKLVPALLAASTALMIAFVAYPWQKKKDRDLQILQVKQLAYSHFFATCQRFYSAMYNQSEDKIDEVEGSFRAAINEMYLYASPDVLHEIKGMIAIALIWQAAIADGFEADHDGDTIQQKFEEMAKIFSGHENMAIKLARSEVLGENILDSDDAITLWEDGRYVRFPNED